MKKRDKIRLGLSKVAWESTPFDPSSLKVTYDYTTGGVVSNPGYTPPQAPAPQTPSPPPAPTTRPLLDPVVDWSGKVRQDGLISASKGLWSKAAPAIGGWAKSNPGGKLDSAGEMAGFAIPVGGAALATPYALQGGGWAVGKARDTTRKLMLGEKNYAPRDARDYSFIDNNYVRDLYPDWLKHGVMGYTRGADGTLQAPQGWARNYVTGGFDRMVVPHVANMAQGFGGISNGFASRKPLPAAKQPVNRGALTNFRANRVKNVGLGAAYQARNARFGSKSASMFDVYDAEGNVVFESHPENWRTRLQSLVAAPRGSTWAGSAADVGGYWFGAPTWAPRLGLGLVNRSRGVGDWMKYIFTGRHSPARQHKPGTGPLVSPPPEGAGSRFLEWSFGSPNAVSRGAGPFLDQLVDPWRKLWAQGGQAARNIGATFRE